MTSIAYFVHKIFINSIQPFIPIIIPCKVCYFYRKSGTLVLPWQQPWEFCYNEITKHWTVHLQCALAVFWFSTTELLIVVVSLIIMLATCKFILILTIKDTLTSAYPELYGFNENPNFLTHIMILTTRLTQIVPERSITKVKWGVQSFTDIKARGSAMRGGCLTVAVLTLNVYSNNNLIISWQTIVPNFLVPN